LRPAEKLYEELLIGESVAGTEHPMIMRAMEHHVPWVQLRETLAELLDALDSFDCERARELLISTVVEYRPASSIQDLVWLQALESDKDRTNVTVLRVNRLRVGRSGAALPLAN